MFSPGGFPRRPRVRRERAPSAPPRCWPLMQRWSLSSGGSSKDLVAPARIGLVELANQRGELEIADSDTRRIFGEAIDIGTGLSGEVVAQDVQRPRRRGIELDLAGTLEAIKTQECLRHRPARRQDAVVAQQHGGVVTEVLQQAAALIEIEAGTFVVVIAEFAVERSGAHRDRQQAL